MKVCVFLTSVAMLLWMGASAQAAILKSYDFTSGLGDTLLQGNDLTAGGGTVAGGLYSFGPNQGLRLTDALPSTTDYAIEMRLRFDDGVAGWAKILDFQDRTIEDGLYVWADRPIFYPISDQFGSVTAGQFFTFGLERVNGLLTAFLNGVQVMSILDVGNNAVPGANTLNFFVDDIGGPIPEVFAGAVDFIRIHEDRSTFGVPTVPVPASLPLLAAGLGLFGVMRRWKRG